jgi:hypothetical protein
MSANETDDLRRRINERVRREMEVCETPTFDRVRETAKKAWEAVQQTLPSDAPDGVKLDLYRNLHTRLLMEKKEG